MFIDKQNLLSDDQAITSTAASTNIIDLGEEGSKVPTPNEKNIGLHVQVTTDFSTSAASTMKAALQTCADSTFSGTVVTLLETGTKTFAQLVAGYQYPLNKLPNGLLRYIRAYYTVAGTAAEAGTVTAALVLDKQTNE